jgi:hypothetical protein
MTTVLVQTWLSTVVDAILTKISTDHKLDLENVKNSIGPISLTDDIDASIVSYCNSLKAVVEKPKKLIKKKIVLEPVATTPEPVTTKVEPLATTLETPATTLELPVTTLEQTKVKKVLKKKVVASDNPDGVSQPIETLPKKVVKKKIIVSEDVHTPTAKIIVEETPKKLLKKKETSETVIAVEETEKEVVDNKPKKIIKKRVTVDVTEDPEVKNIDEPEQEVKLAPKKIIKKKPAVSDIPEISPKKQSKKNIDVAEYGVEGEETHNIYETSELYEDDSVERREINGVIYYIDTSNYIYEFESMDLIGKLNEQDNNKIIFLADFTSSDEESLKDHN